MITEQFFEEMRLENQIKSKGGSKPDRFFINSKLLQSDALSHHQSVQAYRHLFLCTVELSPAVSCLSHVSPLLSHPILFLSSVPAILSLRSSTSCCTNVLWKISKFMQISSGVIYGNHYVLICLISWKEKPIKNKYVSPSKCASVYCKPCFAY